MISTLKAYSGLILEIPLDIQPDEIASELDNLGFGVVSVTTELNLGIAIWTIHPTHNLTAQKYNISTALMYSSRDSHNRFEKLLSYLDTHIK